MTKDLDKMHEKNLMTARELADFEVDRLHRTYVIIHDDWSTIDAYNDELESICRLRRALYGTKIEK